MEKIKTKTGQNICILIGVKNGRRLGGMILGEKTRLKGFKRQKDAKLFIKSYLI